MSTGDAATKSPARRRRARRVSPSGLSPVGELLRHWRRVRGMSQLDLSLQADVSSRHLSFVETGRSKPSAELLLQLAGVLDVPLRERNALLQAAGFANVYGEADLDSPELAPARRALDFLLEHHEPFPAVVVDRAWNAELFNAAAMRWIGSYIDIAALLARGKVNAIEVLFDPEGLRPFVKNFDELGPAMLQWIHRDLLTGDPGGRLSELLERVLAYGDIPEEWTRPNPSGLVDPLVAVDLEKDGRALRLFSTITTLGSPRDITLQEIRIETFFPADAESEAFLRELA